MLYLDTSVLLAYYCPETFSDTVEELLEANPQPLISQLTEIEVASAVSLKVRTRDLGRQDALRIVRLFQRHSAEGLYSIVPVEAKAFRVSRQWLEQFSSPLRSLDALHLAVASLNDATLVTADRQFAKSAAHFGVPCDYIR